MSSAALRITQLAMRYDGVPVFDGVDLTLEAGQCLALTGLNGAGKSTLLHCLLNFIRADAGAIDIDGHPHHLPSSRKHLAYLPERFTPPPFLTGTAFLRHMAALHRQRWDAHAAQLEWPADVLQRPCGTYSKGMAQQLGLMACMLVKPKLLVLDEPFSGLDPQAAFHVEQMLRTAHAAGVAILFTSHNLGEVRALADRVAILQSGQLRTIEREQIADESLFVHHRTQ